MTGPSDSPSLQIDASRADSLVMTALAGLMVAASSLFGALRPVAAQSGEFQIVWVVIGEASTVGQKQPVRVARQLFLASDLLTMTLENKTVARVDIEPVVVEIGVGDELCLSTLKMRASRADGHQVDGAPLSVAIRQDHKDRLGLKRTRNDICVQPANAGEYPVRLTSLLPALDGTMRGAQVFLRAKDAPVDVPPTGAQSGQTN